MTKKDDYEFGAHERDGTLQRIKDHDRVWEAEVAQRKLEGRWPPSKYRDPHPWENGVVKPPKEDPAPRSTFDPKKPSRERLMHLIACIKALKVDQRPIPGHMLSEMVWLKAHWDGFDIPPEAIEARRALERS